MKYPWYKLIKVKLVQENNINIEKKCSIRQQSCEKASFHDNINRT